MTQLSNVLTNSSSPARSETVVDTPVSEYNTNAHTKPGAGALSLERCIDIFNRTRRCNHSHTEFQYPDKCGVELTCCRVCGKIQGKRYL